MQINKSIYLQSVKKKRKKERGTGNGPESPKALESRISTRVYRGSVERLDILAKS